MKLKHMFNKPKKKKIELKNWSLIYQVVAFDTSLVRRKLHETSDNFLVPLFLSLCFPFSNPKLETNKPYKLQLKSKQEKTPQKNSFPKFND